MTLSTISLPEFVAAYFVIYLLTQVFPIFQPVAMVFPGMGFWEKLQAVALPVIVLVLVVLAHMMRMTRAAVLNVMQSAYIETAELKGLGPMTVIWRHALPNAIAPIISVVVLNLAYLVVGVVVVEVVFSYNALGQYLVDHVAKRDLPVVQAVGLIFAAVYIGLNILADLIGIIVKIYMRANMIASGKMFVANNTPNHILQWFDWNPLFHTIDQGRGFIFLNYNPHYSSIAYPIIITLICIVIGLMGEFYTKQYASLSWQQGK